MCGRASEFLLWKILIKRLEFLDIYINTWEKTERQGKKKKPVQQTSIRAVRAVATGMFKENDSLATSSLAFSDVGLSASSYFTL